MQELKTQEGKYEITISPERERGYFEHEIYGEDAGGGLWFEGKNLVDYDGMAILPDEVIAGIRKLGYTVDKDFEL
jgi:hypothetical protein